MSRLFPAIRAARTIVRPRLRFVTAFLLALEGAAAAQITVTPAQADFGTVLTCNQSPPKNFAITNAGPGPVTVTSVTLGGLSSAHFVADNPGRFDLAGGQSMTVAVYFKPFVAGNPHTASLVVTPQGSPAVVARLTGVGVVPQLQISTGQVPADTLDFDLQFPPPMVGTEVGPLAVGLKVPSLGFPLSIDRVALMGESDFRIDPPPKLDLGPGETTVFNVYFKPRAAGLRSGTAFVYSKCTSPVELATLVLRGTGAPGAAPPDLGGNQGARDLAEAGPGTAPIWAPPSRRHRAAPFRRPAPGVAVRSGR